MPVSVHCPQCGQPVSIPDQAAGKRLKCPNCQQIFLAPGVLTSANDDDDWLQMDDVPVTLETPPVESTDQNGSPASDISFSGADSDPFVEGNVFDEFDEFTAESEALPQSTPIPPTASETMLATEYRVKCKVCDSIMFAKASQAGKTVKCSDCHSAITIPPPPKIENKQSFDIETAQTFSLSEPKSVRDRDFDPNRKSAEQLLEEAAREDDETTEIRYADTPDIVEWLKGIFGIFRDLSVITHWIGLSLLAIFPAILVLSVDHPYLYTMLLPGALFFGAIVVSCGFAILQSVANDEDHVSEWPLFDPPSWFGELIVAVAAAAVVAVPIGAAAHMLNTGMVGVAFTMFAIYAFFPFVLLSMMDMNSIFQPFSPEVARSVTKCEEAWGGFYFSSGILFAILFLLIVTANPTAPLGAAICICVSVAASFIYFAMIGRLAYAIGQAVNAPRKADDVESTSSIDS